MAMEQMMAFIQSLPPEQQQQAMQQMQLMAQQEGGGGQMPPAPGMATQQPPQDQDPRMGLPGQNNPQQGLPGAFQDFEGQSGVIGDQQAQAEALRGTPNAQGIQTANAGFVASNPLSALATVGSRIKGGYDANKALEEKKALSDTKTKLLEKFAAGQLSQGKEQDLAKELRGNRRGYNSSMSA